MEQKKEIKSVKRRLLFQVGAIILVVFSVLIAGLGFLLIHYGRKSFFLGLQSTMEEQMKQIQEVTAANPLFEWTTDYWTQYPEQMKRDFSLDEFAAVAKSKYAAALSEENGEVDIEALNKEALSYRISLARYNTELFALRVLTTTLISKNAVLFVDLRKEKRGTVYLQFPFQTSPTEAMGKAMPELFEEEESVNVPGVESQGNEKYYYAEHTDRNGLNTYIGYTPVYAGGEPRFALVLVNDWSDDQKGQLRFILWMLAAFLIIIVIGGAFLLLFISSATVGPVKRLRYGVRKYARDKNPEELKKDMGEVKNRNELGELAQDISDMADEIDRYMQENIRLAGEREAAAAELSIATRVQQEQLASGYPDSPFFTLRAFIRPAREVGGDFYDFFLLDDTHLVLLIADVSDKGMNAAFFMAISKAMIKSWALKTRDPVRILTEAESMIKENNPGGLFVTVWLAVIDLETGHVEVCNAGHDYPMIYREGKYTFEKSAHGPAMAFLPGVPHVGTAFELAPGDRIFLYTDGVTEASDGKRRFGTEQLLTTLNETAEVASDQEIIDRVRTAVDRFAGDAPQFDDITMLSFTYKGRKGD